MGKKLGVKSIIWSRSKKKTFNQNSMKKQEFKKTRRGLETSRTTLNIPKFKTEACQKEKRKSKKLKTYLKK